MSVYRNKQRNDVWMYEFWRDGVRYRDYCRDPATGDYVKTKKAALEVESVEKARAIEAGRANRPRGGAGRGYSIGTAQAAALKRVAEKRRDPKHIANIRLWGDDIIRHFGAGALFAELDQKAVDDYVSAVFTGTVKKWIGGNKVPTDEEYDNPDLWHDTGRRRSKRQGNNYCKHLLKLLGLAAKVRDGNGKPILAQEPPLEIELEKVPRRKPRPMPDDEFSARIATLPPWRQDHAMLSRFYGLRAEECVRVELRHLEGDAEPVIFFRGEEAKSGHDERARSGPAGWKLVNRLRRQAEKRGATFLLTWPGVVDGVNWYPVWARGERVPAKAWVRLKGVGTAWRKSAKRAGIQQPHRFHDVRARFITSVAIENKAAAKGAARHQSSATTDLYIGVADEIVADAVAGSAMPRSARAAKAGRAKLRAVR